MSSMKRLRSIVVSLLMIFGCMVLLISPKEGYVIVVFILDITFLVYGFRMLVYYFTMARYMVGGIMTLYKSIIAIDFGLFVINLKETPIRLIMLYLMGLMLFHGITAILAAVDAKKLEYALWKRKFIYGLVMLVLTGSCIFLWDSAQAVTVIYCLGLIHAAIYNIVKAFQKTAIIHIE